MPPRLGRAALRCRLALGFGFGFAFGFIALFTEAFAAAGLGLPRYLLSATKGRLRLGESLINLGLLAYCFSHHTRIRMICLALDHVQLLILAPIF